MFSGKAGVEIVILSTISRHPTIDKPYYPLLCVA
jgi:hypothetical protein